MEGLCASTSAGLLALQLGACGGTRCGGAPLDSWQMRKGGPACRGHEGILQIGVEPLASSKRAQPLLVVVATAGRLVVAGNGLLWHSWL